MERSSSSPDKFPRRIRVTDLQVGDAWRREVHSWTVAILVEPITVDPDYNAPVTRYVMHGVKKGLVWANSFGRESVWLLARLEEVQSPIEE